MPGPYAHITLLYELMRPFRLKSIFSSSSGFEAALTEYFPYCALGAVSPDFPNLNRQDITASQWADAMHCTLACDIFTSGIRRVRGSKGKARDKQLAWLLGYCSHVAADVTIHPIVQAKVGVYAENHLQHRICEMNQDSYIYRRMNLGEIGDSDYFALVVALCSNSDDRFRLDRDIAVLWEGMLADVHPEIFALHQADSASWYRIFVAMVVKRAASAKRLFPLAGIIIEKIGLDYPASSNIDQQFIEEQMVPSKRALVMHYDEIFDHAAGNIALLWRQVEQAVCTDNPEHMPYFGDWNLDTGLDERNRLVFW